MPRPIFQNPRVFLDIAVAGCNAGRLNIELFHDALPTTCENFRALCTGETGLGYWLRPRWYKNTKFHRIVPNFMCQGGDFNFGSGKMGESIYGQRFRDEGFLYSHNKRGILSMARNEKPHTNNSQFFFTFNNCEWLDGKHVAFGQIFSGESFECLDAIEKVGSEGGAPLKRVEIFGCGEYHLFKDRDVFDIEVEKPESLVDIDSLSSRPGPVPDEVWKVAQRL